MIKKLMKYDVKKMIRVVIYIYAIAIILAVATRLINIGKNIQSIYIIGKFFEGFTYSAVASILINTFIHILNVFIVNFFRDESYLTHTLPVKKSELLISKYLSALIVTVISFAVCFLSLFIMLYSSDFIKAVKGFVELTVAGFNMSVGLFIALLVFIIFAEICALISMTFAAVVKANTYNSKRIIKGLLWFGAYYLISSLATLIVAVIVFLINGNISELLAEMMSQSSFVTILIIAAVMYSLSAAVYYFVCYKMFKKGVNVD